MIDRGHGNPIVLVPGIGMWTTGRDLRSARLARDIYLHGMLLLPCYRCCMKAFLCSRWCHWGIGKLHGLELRRSDFNSPNQCSIVHIRPG